MGEYCAIECLYVFLTLSLFFYTNQSGFCNTDIPRCLQSLSCNLSGLQMFFGYLLNVFSIYDISAADNEIWGRIFSQAGNELGASSFSARNELTMIFPYTSFTAGNELILKLTKNTATDFLLPLPIPQNV